MMANRPTLELHIPEPAARPGDPVQFDTSGLPQAGETRRPPVDCRESEMRDMPFGLVRVLAEGGEAVGPWVPRVDSDVLVRGLTAMQLTRAFDERLFRAHRQGKTSFYMKSTGEEAVSAAAALAMGRDDMCFPTYRNQAWLMARDYPLVDLANQIFSNAKDPILGRQLPVLYSAKSHGFYSISGNLGSRFGHAVGWAMASAYRGDDNIAIGYVGDGTTAEGNVHEALVFASVYRAPVILAVTNNQWAISSFVGIAGGDKTTFAARAIGYGLPGLRVDGNDFLAVWAAIEWAAERARANLGATLIEFYTYRVEGHSTSDDPTRYRPKDEPPQWPLGDPVVRLKDHLITIGAWDEDRHMAMVADCTERVKAAVKEAEAVGTLGKSQPPIETMFEDVFAKRDWRLDEQRAEVLGEGA